MTKDYYKGVKYVISVHSSYKHTVSIFYKGKTYVEDIKTGGKHGKAVEFVKTRIEELIKQ